jgi:hypothetical protein
MLLTFLELVSPFVAIFNGIFKMITWFGSRKRERQAAEQALQSVLEIASTPEPKGTHYRVKVHNNSKTTVRFKARLISIVPEPGNYNQGSFLQISQTPPPHLEADIEGGGDAYINVFARVEFPDHPPFYGLLVASEPVIAPIPIKVDYYAVSIRAVPVLPQGVPSKTHKFYITPQTGEKLLLSDGGEVWEKH